MGSVQTQQSQVPIIQKYSPITGELIQQYPVADGHTVRQAVAIARQVFPAYSRTSFRQRARLLTAVARKLQDEMDDWAALITRETGKPFRESLESDILTAVNVLFYDAAKGPKFLRDRWTLWDKTTLLGRISRERRLPKGVVGVISPWNYPLSIPVSGVAAALMAGNTVVLKPSELTPGIGEAIGELFRSAARENGLDENIVQVLTGDGGTGARLVDAEIDHLVFTGSSLTGKKIEAQLRPRGISVSLEMGGCDPMIVLDSATDLDAVAAYALWGRMTNAGQSCSAVKRLLIPKTGYDAFVNLLREKLEQLRTGSQTGHDDPTKSDEATSEPITSQIGPLISKRQWDLLDSQVQDAVAKGAKIYQAVQKNPEKGYFYPPTLLTDIPKNARVLEEETFGPVLPVIAYETVEEAIAIANNSAYGLGGSVFGSFSEAVKVAERLEVGAVSVNDVSTTTYALPSVHWHGWKASGPGTSHGKQGLLEMTRSQTVIENLLYAFPVFRKQCWHFSKPAAVADLAFSRSLVRDFGSGSLLDKLKPGFLLGFWRNRSGRKL